MKREQRGAGIQDLSTLISVLFHHAAHHSSHFLSLTGRRKIKLKLDLTGTAPSAAIYLDFSSHSPTFWLCFLGFSFFFWYFLDLHLTCPAFGEQVVGKKEGGGKVGSCGSQSEPTAGDSSTQNHDLFSGESLCQAGARYHTCVNSQIRDCIFIQFSVVQNLETSLYFSLFHFFLFPKSFGCCP